jgi:hypothetical protein
VERFFLPVVGSVNFHFDALSHRSPAKKIVLNKQGNRCGALPRISVTALIAQALKQRFNQAN